MARSIISSLVGNPISFLLKALLYMFLQWVAVAAVSQYYSAPSSENLVPGWDIIHLCHPELWLDKLAFVLLWRSTANSNLNLQQVSSWFIHRTKMADAADHITACCRRPQSTIVELELIHWMRDGGERVLVFSVVCCKVRTCKSICSAETDNI